MNVNRGKWLGLPVVLSLATLPGAIVAVVGDMVARRQFLHTVALAPSVVSALPGWQNGMLTPYSLYYVAGISLGFFLLAGADILFGLSPALCRAYTGFTGGKWGRIAGTVLGIAFGLGAIIVLNLSVGPGLVMVGCAPAAAVGWWLKGRGDWPTAGDQGGPPCPGNTEDHDSVKSTNSTDGHGNAVK